MKQSLVYALIALILAISLLTGCTEGQRAQRQIQDAFAKQEEIINYRFSGNANISLHPNPIDAEKHSLTAGIFALLLNSTYAWNGTISKDPFRFETDIHMLPAGSAEPIVWPLLIKDNKMYFTIPSVSQEGEYFQIDLNEKTDHDDADGWIPANLQNAGKVSTMIISQLIDAMEPKWFTSENARPKNKGEKVITLHISQKNIRAIAASLIERLPMMIDEMQSKGLITPEQAIQWHEKANPPNKNHWDTILETIKLNEPGLLRFQIDTDGYIRELVIQLDYGYEYAGGTPVSHRIHYTSQLDEINKNPAFIKEIPESAKPLAEILKFLQPATP